MTAGFAKQRGMDLNGAGWKRRDELGFNIYVPASAFHIIFVNAGVQFEGRFDAFYE